MSQLEIYRDRFAESGWEVFEGAIEESRRRGQNLVGVEHVIHALIRLRAELFNSLLSAVSDNPDAPSMLAELIEERVRDAPSYTGEGVRLAAETIGLFKGTLDLVRSNVRRRIEATDLFVKMLLEEKSLLLELLRKLLAEPKAEAKEVRDLVTLVESVSAGRPAGRQNFPYIVDEVARVRGGPFAEVDEGDNALQVRVFIMGREQPVTLRFLDVEKISSI
jgi:ATP-dependent Clp protease ATP-binding subunit ClpA